jgi:enoyl-CoA hydratase/carnithine racemase
MADIEFTRLAEGIGAITLNRPEKRNAFNVPMRLELQRLLRSEELQELRVVILRAAGAAFSAGADLKEIGQGARPGDIASAADLFTVFRRTSPVTIAAVQGYALGLGSGIAMAADVVIAAEDAQFGYPEVVHGLVAGITMIALRELVGPRKAMELLVTGRRVGAAEALAIGMVNEVVPVALLGDRALELALQIAANSPLAVRTTKRFFYEAAEMPYGVAVKAGERVIELMRKSKDAQEGAAAFVGRRPASYDEVKR